MTIRDELARWQQHVADNWEREVQRGMTPALERARTDPKRLSLLGFALLTPAALAEGPARIEPQARELSALIGPAMAARPEQKTIGDLGIGSLANLLACCGYPDETAPLADWLYEIETHKDRDPLCHWARGFAALALDVVPLYRALGGHPPDEPVPFTAGERCGWNVQGFLRHLAGAVETGARFEDVRPALDEFLNNWGTHAKLNNLDKDALVWIARVVRHRIAGEPLCGVAQWLHEYVVDLAASMEAASMEGGRT
jgi:hypothetical protein